MNKDEIMKQFDEAIKNLKEWVEGKKELKPATCTECGCTFVDARTMCAECLMKLGKEPKPEWEDRLDGDYCEPYFCSVAAKEIIKNFFRSELKALGEEIKKKAPICNNVVNEALRKRGVK
jgi:hypothetical protein